MLPAFLTYDSLREVVDSIHNFKSSKKPSLLDDSLLGRDKQILLELVDYVIYEPELSSRLLNDLKEVFRSVNKAKAGLR